MSHQVVTVMGIQYSPNESLPLESLSPAAFQPVYTVDHTIIGVSPSIEVAYEVAQELRQDIPELRCVFHVGPVPPHSEYVINTTIQHCIYVLEALDQACFILTQPVYQQAAEYFTDRGVLTELGAYRLADLLPPTTLYQLTSSEQDHAAELHSLDRYQHNLPTQSTSFLGREQALIKLTTALKGSERLISLIGPSGIGKTRLALQAAARVLKDVTDGIFFVACAPLQKAHEVPMAIAHVLGVKETVKEPLEQTLYRHLDQKNIILILDNVEQIEGLAPLLQNLLEHTTSLKLFITSQEPLQIASEQLFEVPPFTLPDPNNLPDIDTFEAIPVIALFLNRARDVQPNLIIDNYQAPTIARICQAIEGLPIAVELVAAHINKMPLEQMYHEIASQLEPYQNALTTRDRLINPILMWSMQYLEQSTRRIFARLGVFVGGFMIEDAEAVCITSDHDDLVEDVPNELINLLNHNLLLYEELAEGMSRYIMLDGIHEFARSLCQSLGEWDMIQQQHLSYYRDAAERTEPLLEGQDMQYWLQWVNSQIHNFNTALAYGIQGQHSEDALRLAGALGYFWAIASHHRTGKDWLDQAIAIPGGSAEARSRANVAQSMLYISLGLLNEAEQLCLQALEFQKELNIPEELARIYNSMGIIAAYRGQSSESISWFERKIQLLEKHQISKGLLASYVNLGATLGRSGRYEEALSQFKQALNLARQEGNLYGIMKVLGNLGGTYLILGHYTEAKPFYQEGLEVARKVGNTQTIAHIQSNLGKIAIKEQDLEAAQQFMHESLRIFLQVQSTQYIAHTLDGFVALKAAQQDYTAAAQLLGAANQLYESQQIVREQFDRDWIDQVTTEVQQYLSEAEWLAAKQHGQEQDLMTLLKDLNIIT